MPVTWSFCRRFARLLNTSVSLALRLSFLCSVVTDAASLCPSGAQVGHFPGGFPALQTHSTFAPPYCAFRHSWHALHLVWESLHVSSGWLHATIEIPGPFTFPRQGCFFVCVNHWSGTWKSPHLLRSAHNRPSRCCLLEGGAWSSLGWLLSACLVAVTQTTTTFCYHNTPSLIFLAVKTGGKKSLVQM